MSINIGASPIVKDGLVLLLDASSSLNYNLQDVEVLVVAGGGGGGANHAGGGGAGGLIYRNSHTVTPGTPITVTVGLGGATASSSIGPAASNGQNSVFDTLVAIGGGGGGNRNDSDGTSPGRDGGSGGGGGGAQTQFAGNYTPGNGVSGQGFAGGRAVDLYGGGGGGAGGKGFDGVGATLLNSGNGGPGLLYNISGTPRYYAGGGGAGYGGNVGSGLGGVGGGGRGGIPAGDAGTPGQANTGGGGGGGGAGGQPGSAGGSGVVIVRYPGPQKATGGTITQVGGYTIHTFNSSSTFTPLAAPVNGGAVYGLQDLSGNGYTFRALGSPTYEIHRSTPCINFDGGSSDVKCLSRDGKLYHDIASACTVEIVYCSISNAEFNGCSRLFSLNDGSANNVDFSNYWGLPSCDNTKHGLWYNTSAGGNPNGFYSTSATRTATDEWKVLTFKWTVGKTCYVFVNGVQENNTPITNVFNYRNVNRMTLAMNAALNIEHANVRVALVRMYDVELTNQEVLQNFNALRGRFGI